MGQPNAVTLPKVAEGGCFPRGQDERAGAEQRRSTLKRMASDRTSRRRPPLQRESQGRESDGLAIAALQAKPLLVRSASAEQLSTPTWLQVRDLQPGTLTLGCIVSVQQHYAVVMLPFGIWGVLPLSSRPVGELDGCLNQPDRGGPQTGLVCADSTPALPLSVLRQSLLRVCVMNWPSSSSALEPERISVHQGRTRECSILLSADPRFVNRGLGLSEKLHDYGLIQVRLSLPLDHTNERFEVEALAEDLAQNRRILLRSTEENDKDHAGCRPGRICWAALESWHEQRRVAVLSNEHAAIVGALTRGHWTLEQLSPGMLVDGRVIRRYASYALVRFLDVFDGILEWFHLDRMEDFNGLEPGRELRVRILYIDLARRYIALSARTSLTERLELPLTVAAARRYHRGCFVEHLQVTRVDRSRGIWFHKDGETVRFFADRHAISDERSGQLEHLFPPGKIMSRARVISHMAIEGIVRVTLKPSLLQRKFLDYAELEAGALVRCSIVGWENSSSGDAGREKRRSLLVDVEGCLPGCIPVEHLTDVPMRLHRLEKKFPKGSSLRCRVWDVQPKKKRVLLTARKSLVESSLPVLAGWDQVKIGQVYHGLVADRDGTGSYRVLFYKRISGILLSNPAMKAAALTPGQVICVRVDRILERRRKQLMVSLANDVPMETGGELALTCGSIVRIQRAFQDQVGRILAIVEGASEADGTQPTASTGTRLVLLPMQHLTDYPMLRGHWASETGLQALAGELAVVLDNGADGSMPLISHRWTILRASQLSMLPAEISGPVTVGAHGVGLVHAMEPTLAYIVMRLGVSHRRVRVQRPLLADRFVETSTQVLEEGQLVFYHVRKGRRFSLRYSDIRAALGQEPFRQLCLEIRALDALVREQMRLWQRWGHLKSSSSLPPLPGSLVRARILRVTAETMDVDVQHEQDLYRGTVDPYHFPEEEHIEAMSAEAVTEGETRSSTGRVFTALVLWSDPLCNQLVLSRRSSLLRTAPWCWLGQNGEPPKCLTARVLATYGEIAILWSKHGLAFMSTLDINGRARERPCFVGQELNVTADGRTPLLAGEDPPTWARALLRASVRPAVAGKESPDRRREESSTVGTRRRPVSIMQVGALVSTAQVTAVHPFQVHVRWAGGHTGRIHMTNVDDEKTFVALKVGSTLPQARIVAQRKTRQWELSLRKRDLETTTNPRIDSKVSVGDLFDLAVVKQTDRDSKGLIRTVRLYIRPDMVARLSRFEATPRILDDSWVPGHFVRQLRLLRIDKARRRYYLTAVEPMAAGQCIAGARIRSLHPGDGLVRVQLPRGRLGVLFVGNMAPSQSRHPFEEIRITQKLDVYLLHDWDQSSSDEVPVTAIRGQGPIAWKQLHQGDLVDAFVRRVDNAGVFVNLAPGLVARCLLRDLASGFVQDPVAAFPVGMRVRAMVVDSGVNERHIRVSFRAVQESGSGHGPAESSVQVGRLYLGRVRNIVPYGVFLDVLGSETSARDSSTLATGLCHRSELVDNEPWPLPSELPQLFHIGQQMPVLVTAVDPTGRLSLTMKPTPVKLALAEQSMEKRSQFDAGTQVAAEYVTNPKRTEVQATATMSWSVASSPAAPEDDKAEMPCTRYDNEDGRDTYASLSMAFSKSVDFVSSDALTQTHTERPIGSKTTLQETPSGQGAAATWKRSVQSDTMPPFLEVPNHDDQVSEEAPADSLWSMSMPTSGELASPRQRIDDESLERGERELVEALDRPQTVADYERVLLGRPNDPHLWISYMALHFSSGNLPEARAIAERALQTIHFREQASRLRVWIAYLNLERHANPSLDPLGSEVFRRALENCDSEQLHLRFARALEAAQEPATAMRVYEHACQRHGHRLVSVWTSYGAFCFLRSAQAAQGRKILERALRTLTDPTQHIQCILKFATFEFKGCGEPERGRTLLESLIQAFPKRLDFWNVYIDMETVLLRQQRGKLDLVRQVLRRCTALPNLSLKQAKHFFKRFIELEREFGDESSVKQVKDAARAYVAQRTT